MTRGGGGHLAQQLSLLLHPICTPVSAAINDGFFLQDIYTGGGTTGVGEDGSWTAFPAVRPQQQQLLQAALLQLDYVRVGLARASEESDRLRDLLRALAREREAARRQCRQAQLLLQLHLGGQPLEQQAPTPKSPVPSLAAMVPQPPFLLNENSSVGTGFSSQEQQRLALHHPPSASSSDENNIVSSPPLPQKHGGAVDTFGWPPPPPPQKHVLGSKKMRLDEPYSVKHPLPERGRLLTAVLNAGPLLQDLLLMGRVPQWHNPPSSPTHDLDVVVPHAPFATGSGSSGGNVMEQVQGLRKRKDGAGKLIMA